MLIVKTWRGRLGNNIIQLSNIIHISLFYKQNVCFKRKHYLFNVNTITKYLSKYKNDKNLTDRGDFFESKSTYPKEVFEQNIEKVNEIMKQSFTIKNVKKLDENDLIIHIRSGDIFTDSRPHPRYVPPPLSYYTNIIDRNNYKNIIIICEDTINPVVNKLLELYENAIHNKNSLEEDVKIVLGASSIISSVGTFIPTLLKFSDNIKYHYRTHSYSKELKKYYSINKPWKNTKQQREYILSYTFE